ncbi:MAG: Eco57I restriction-modification methylase domain-containing protein [Candidatus Hodarchaeota archaeon]
MDKKEVKEQIQILISTINAHRMEKKRESSQECGIITAFIKKLGWEVQVIGLLKEIEAEAFYLHLNDQKHIALIEKEIDANLDKSYVIDDCEVNAEKFIINFAWHHNLKWVLFTNGVELRAYYSLTDLPHAKILTLNFREPDKNLDQLWLFSTENWANNSIKSYEKHQTRKEITQSLFETLFLIRQKLIEDISKLESSLSNHELHESIQRILNRLLFVRVFEDRGIIQTETLALIVKNWKKNSNKNSKPLIFHLNDFFNKFNSQYEVQIFEKHSCDSLLLRNNTLEDILHLLYRYNFKWLNTGLLGQIYEEYLDSILHQSQLVVKKAKNDRIRKRKGIYYTPQAIVEYMVSSTLESELEKIWKKTRTYFDQGDLVRAKKSFEMVRNLKIVDPACGAGFFLLKALETIAKYYEKYHRIAISPIINYEEEILKSIYGVDIDPQAAELTSMNLLLKIAKSGKPLPKLSNITIKVGNSLLWKPNLEEDRRIQRLAELRSTLMQVKQKKVFDRTVEKIKALSEELRHTSQQDLEFFEISQVHQPFNWTIEFPEVLLDGGFDTIVGNPPYVENRQLDRTLKKFYVKNFETTMGRFSLFVPFLELAIKILKPNKPMAFVLHRNIIRSEIYRKIRKFILDTCRIIQIVDLGSSYFKDVTGEMVILVMQKEENHFKRQNNKIEIVYEVKNLLKKVYSTKFIPQSFFYKSPFYIFNIALTEKKKSLIDKIEEGSIPLGKILDTRQGIIVGNEKKLVSKRPLDPKYRKVLRGKNVDKYKINFDSNYVLYDREQLVAAREERIFLEKEKILTQHVSSEIKACIDTEQHYALQTINLIIKRKEYPSIDLKYIVGLLNSKLMGFYYETMFNMGAKFTTAISNRNLDNLPIKFGTEKQRNEVSKVVTKIQDLKKKKVSPESQKQILGLQKRIDLEICDIYNVESGVIGYHKDQ